MGLDLILGIIWCDFPHDAQSFVHRAAASSELYVCH